MFLHLLQNYTVLHAITLTMQTVHRSDPITLSYMVLALLPSTLLVPSF